MPGAVSDIGSIETNRKHFLLCKEFTVLVKELDSLIHKTVQGYGSFDDGTHADSVIGRT